MEYLGGGSALDLMKAGSFSENDIAIILREILLGLQYLHSERKLHRDIKGEFILKLSSIHRFNGSANKIKLREMQSQLCQT